MAQRRWFGLAGALLAATIAAVACSTESARMIVDAGEMLLPDAAAQPPDVTVLELDCDQVQNDVRYAEASVDGLDPSALESVTAIACGLEGVRLPDAPYDLSCYATPRIDVEAGRVRVFCGAGDPAIDGYHWRSVRVVLR